MSPFNRDLERHTATAIARLVTTHGVPADGAWPVPDVLGTAATVVAELGLTQRGGRRVAARQHVACYVAVYARWFAPRTATARLVGQLTEAPALAWDVDGERVVDVLDCGNGSAPLCPAAVRLADAEGTSLRVLRLAAPRTSRRRGPGGWLPLHEPVDIRTKLPQT